MKKTVLSAVIAGAIALGAAVPAGAADMFFYYDATGSFVDTGSGFPDASLSNADRTLSWGTPVPDTGPQSSATLNGGSGSNPQGLDVTDGPWMPYTVTNGVLDSRVGVSNNFDFANQPTTEADSWAVMGYLVHSNNPIAEAFTGTVNLDYSVNIYADNGGSKGAYIDTVGGTFTLEYWETLNSTPCEGDNPFGSDCDDRFRYKFAGASEYTTLEDALIGSFTYNDTEYNVSMTGFICPVEGCIGQFYSPEGGDRLAVVNLEVHAVPEPATLALMGLGLAGIGFSRHRRKQREDMQA